MLVNVFTKTTRERLPAALIGAISLAIFLLFSMWVYRDIDTSFYYDLPAGVLELVGISPDGSGTGGIAFGAIYNMMGALTLGGLALGMGAFAVAGEEQRGTFGLLLGNPVSRRGVLLSKSVSMVLVVGVVTVMLWGAGVGSADLLEVSTDGLHIGALTFALFLSSLFYGFFALAVGGWTGKRGLASGASAGLMVVGYLGASLLPIASLDWLARIFPWYYFASSAPINNGVDWGDMGVLVTLSLLCFGIAFIGVQRRDLHEKGTDVTLLDRLRANPMTQKMMERVAGSTRVSRISVKTASEHQGLFTVMSMIMFYMCILIPLLYNFIPDEFINIFSTFPDALVAMVGGVDMGTPAGFLTGEVFSLVGPIAFIVLATSIGSRALAGEEENHTMGLLLSNPISRARVAMEKLQAMVIYCLILGAITFLTTWAGVSLAGQEEISVNGIAAVSILLTLFGLAYGAVAFVVGAATGRRSMANWTVSGVALVTWFMFTFFPLSDSFAPYAKLSPFRWYLGGEPLAQGMDWTGALLLGAGFILLAAVSLPLFQRRDLRG